MSPILVVLLTLFSISFAQAEEIIQLERIEVSARKKVSEFNFSKPTVLTNADLEEQTSGQLAPHLSQVPGVIANQNGGPGGRVSYFIRGTESRHVAFTLDGLKLNDPSNTDRQFDSAFFTSPFLKQVEVHLGPQAVLFGSDSLGGLIEMTTRKGENAQETRVDFNGGSFGTMDTSISNDWQSLSGNNRGTLTGYRFHTDGISRLNKKRFNATERDTSDITQLSSSSTHQWNAKLETDLLFSFLRGENELDGATDDNSYDESVNDQYIAQQKTNLQISKQAAVSLRNGFNRHHRDLKTLAVGHESYSGSLIQNEALYKSQGAKFDFLTGLSTEHEELKVEAIDESFDLHSLFAQTAYKIDHFKVQGGMRAEKHVRYGSFYTGSGGIAYTLKDHHFALQYSQGFKAPSLYQLYAPPLFGFNIGNNELVPEVNHSWEGSWRLNKQNFETGITLFQNRLSNLITFTMTEGYVNQSRFIAEGVELSGKIKQRYFHLMSNFTHQEFREQESVILRRPLNTLLAGISVFPTDDSETSLKGRWYSSRKDIDEVGNTVKLNGYAVYDLGFRYLFPDVDLGLQVLNIFNREYEELYGYSVMPRSVFFHAGFKF
ncbi:MAG: TonB-dependent receptor [Bdellovibrionales bacterium]|nr:TonB-dependent receptor [Bdellovibrionales bacterium]